MPARALAQFTTDYHDEPSIRALTPEQQWAYDVVLKRPDLARTGVIAYTPRRWAKFAKGMTESRFRKLVDHLISTRHLVLDDDTEELFARTYVRQDGLLKQPNVVAAMVSDYRLISSDHIRTEFLAEMRRIWDLDIDSKARGGWLLAMGHYPDVDDSRAKTFPEAMTAKSLDPLKRLIGPGLSVDLAQAIHQGSVRPFDEGSDKGYPQPFLQGSSRVRAHGPSPSPTPAPMPYADAAAGSAPAGAPAHATDPANTGPHTPPLQQPTRTLALLDEHHPWVPNVRAQLAPVVDQLVTAGIDDEHIRAGLLEWRAAKKGPRYLANLVQDQLTSRATTGPKSRAAQTLALADRLEGATG